MAAAAIIVFDAVGTLIHPQPDVAIAYTRVGRRHGSRLDEADVRGRFRAAFRKQEARDAEMGHITSEEREYQRWVEIVGEVLDDVTDREACFRELYDWFGQPQAWHCADDVGAMLEELTRRGHRLAVASNFDHRLHGVVAGLPELAGLDAVIVSSEVGYRKPHRAFFDTVAQRVAVPASSILYIGDDPDNDLAGATAAGMRAMLIEEWMLSQEPGAGGTRQEARVQIQADATDDS